LSSLRAVHQYQLWIETAIGACQTGEGLRLYSRFGHTDGQQDDPPAAGGVVCGIEWHNLRGQGLPRPGSGSWRALICSKRWSFARLMA